MKNKSIVYILSMLLFIIITGCTIGNKEIKNRDISINPNDFIGIWGSGRITLNISKEAMNTFNINIIGASSAIENIEWTYICNFDERKNYMDCMNGKKIVHEYDRAGNISDKVEYEDGTSIFYYDNKKITWKDYKENAGDKIEFVNDN